MPRTITGVIFKRLGWLEKAMELKLSLFEAVRVSESISITLDQYMNVILTKFERANPCEEKLDDFEHLNELHHKIAVAVVKLKEDLKEDCESKAIWLFGEKTQRRRAERKLRGMMKTVLQIGSLIAEAESCCEALEEDEKE